MPEYHYTCSDGHIVAVWKKMADPHPEKCPALLNEDGEMDQESGTHYCGQSLSRVFDPIPFRFK